jgi:adenosylcobinamide-GDP ribazoletransferase
LKFEAIGAVPATQSIDLLLPPVLARIAVPALFASTPYVRSGGIASGHAAELPRRFAALLVIVSLVATVLVFGKTGALAVCAAAATFLIMRWALMRSLGGTTGDTAGAMVELIETAVLVTIV